MPKVSIITPAYNGAKYIAETIDSVRKQTFQDWEMIIVDDGSVDDTKAVVQRFQEQHPEKIKYFYQTNGGSGKARNTGIRMTTGEFVAFLDADDIWMPQKLEKQMSFFKNNPDIDLVYTNATVINNIGQEKWPYVKKREYHFPPEDIYRQLLLRNFIPFSSVVARRKVIAEVGYFVDVIKYSEDSDLLIRIAKDYRIKYLNEFLTKYRVSDSHKSSNLERRHRASLSIITRHYDKKRAESLKFRFLFRRRCAHVHYDLGYVLLAKNNLREARKEFLVSILLWPFLYLKQYFYFLSGFIPLKTLDQLRYFKRQLANRLKSYAKS